MLRLIADLRCPGRLVVVSTHDARFGEVADAYVRLGPHTRRRRRSWSASESTAAGGARHRSRRAACPEVGQEVGP